MSSNIPMGGADRLDSNHYERVVPIKQKEIPIVSPTVKRIENINEMKLAQTRGEHIPISETQLLKAIEKAFKAIQGPSTQLSFSVHEITKQIMIKVLNSESGEIIREIPPEKSLDLLASLWQMAGILVDERG